MLKFNKLSIILFLFYMLQITNCTIIKDLQTSQDPVEDKSVNIAILLPTQGENSSQSKEYERMIKTGLLENTRNNIKTWTYEINKTTDLQNIANEIIHNKTNIIIGPTSSEDTKKIASLLNNHNIPIFTLSNNPTLTQYSNIIVFGHAPMKQFEVLINYLIDKKHQDFVIMLHNNSKNYYSLSPILENIIKDRGGNVLKKIAYNQSSQDIMQATDKLEQIIDQYNEMDYNINKLVVLVSDQYDRVNILLNVFLEKMIDQKAIIAGINELESYNAAPITLTCTSSLSSKFESIKKRILHHNINLNIMHILAYDIGSIIGEKIGDDYDFINFIKSFQNITPEIEGASGYITFINRVAHRKYDIKYEYNLR